MQLGAMIGPVAWRFEVRSHVPVARDAQIDGGIAGAAYRRCGELLER
jgi:hypothetical protein